MRVTEDNIQEVVKICWLPTFRPMTGDNAVRLLQALLKDIRDLNESTLPELEEKLGITFKFPRVFIGVQDWHDDSDEYPDYYGCLRIYAEEGDKDHRMLDPLSPELDLDGIDENLCTLVSYFDEWLESVKKKEDEAKDKGEG